MNKSVIVTGGEGFIGSHLVDHLVNEGKTVYVIDDESAESNEKFYKNPKATYFNFSITNLSAVPHSIFKESETIYHLAAESRIGPAIKNPIKAVETNVLGTTILLQLAAEFGIEKFIYSSTSSVYGLRYYGPVHENSAIDCLNPYSASKYAGEEMVRMYDRSRKIKTCILRYFNVFGERSPTKGQYAPVIGLFLKAKKANASLKIVGDGEQRRDFVHVYDIVQANIKANISLSTNVLVHGEVYNIGSGINHSINQIASAISENVEYIPEREGEARHTLANIYKAQKELGYAPEIDVMEWIKKNL